jgi:four helix bundle protein
MSEELKKRTKEFALNVIALCVGLPQILETRHAIGQVIRSSSSVAANYRSACRGKSKADFISKLGTVEEEADETGFWLEMLRDIAQLQTFEPRNPNFAGIDAPARRVEPTRRDYRGVPKNGKGKQ